MELAKLFESLDVKIFGDAKISITGLSAHSKEVQKGELFIAKDGNNYLAKETIPQALRSGARAILCSCYHQEFSHVTQVVSRDIVAIEPVVADKFFDYPSKFLWMVGVTGTNGKTSCSYLIRQLLKESCCGLIGTIEYIYGDKPKLASLTTPDAASNHKMLHSMRSHQYEYAVMEATSVALTQNRLNEIDFDIALFTNFSQDHLDYHKTMEKYLEAKSILFTRLKKEGMAIINMDDPSHTLLTSRCCAKVITYGQKKDADYRICEIEHHFDKTSFYLHFAGQNLKVNSSLVGNYNVYNLAAAIAVAIESKIPLSAIQRRLTKVSAPQGRLQKIPNPINAQVYVDFAHTEDALRNVINALRQRPHKKLITVFGCGGDRDPQKRSHMGKTVSQLSDITIITSDNPRNEDPQKICQEIYEGCDRTKKVIIETNRKAAIAHAITLLTSNDILLIAGRGHEPYQVIKGKKIPFLDSQVAEECFTF